MSKTTKEPFQSFHSLKISSRTVSLPVRLSLSEASVAAAAAAVGAVVVAVAVIVPSA